MAIRGPCPTGMDSRVGARERRLKGAWVSDLTPIQGVC